MSKIEPYPLKWPDNWPRTPLRERGTPRFYDDFTPARRALLEEIRKLDGYDVVITSNLPTKRNGLPYVDGRMTDVDSGIAVYWKERSLVKGQGTKVVDRVMACDKWKTPGANLRALALSISALRGIERWGGTSIVDRAFSSFVALPSNAETDWRIELGIRVHEGLGAAREAYRAKARMLHPDKGGDAEAMVRLNQAWEVAQRELT